MQDKAGDRSSSGRSSSTSSSLKPSSQMPFTGDPMAEALNALQRVSDKLVLLVSEIS